MRKIRHFFSHYVKTHVLIRGLLRFVGSSQAFNKWYAMCKACVEGGLAMLVANLYLLFTRYSGACMKYAKGDD
jgi:hypothetical protein